MCVTFSGIAHYPSNLSAICYVMPTDSNCQFTMALTKINWNNLHAHHPAKHVFIEKRICAHYEIFMHLLGVVEQASVRYAFKFSYSFHVQASVRYVFKFSYSFCVYRPTGWHGKSGRMREGGHIMAAFFLPQGRHLTTHHIYPTDDVYQ